MYTKFFELSEPPFQNTADQRFLWPGEKHREALAAMRYGVFQNKGFVLLTGDVGTGKTTLINALAHDIEDDMTVASISDPGLGKAGFLKSLWRLFEIPGDWSGTDEFFVSFENFLRKSRIQGKRVLLIVDEAQKLSDELLEQIRVLSNMELPDKKLINIILVGQNELYQKMEMHSRRALRQRIDIHCQLTALARNETCQYIRHRLKVAGLDREIFQKKALRLIHRYSKGYPRIINRICDHALLTGFVQQTSMITPAIVKECSREILFPFEAANRFSISNLFNKSKIFFRRAGNSTEKIAREENDDIHTSEGSEKISADKPDARSDLQEKLVDPLPEKDRIPDTSTETAAPSRDKARRPLFPKKKWATLSVVLFPALFCGLIVYFFNEGSFHKWNEKRKSRAIIEMSALSMENSENEKSTAAVKSDLPKSASSSMAPAGKENAPKTAKKELPPKENRAEKTRPFEKPAEKKDASEAIAEKNVKPSTLDAESFIEQAKIHIRSKEYDSALEAYGKAAELKPDSPDIYYNLGYLNAQLDKYAVAEEMFARVASMSPPYLDQALFNLAMVQLKQGKEQKSLENLEKALKINPGNEKAIKYMEQLKNTRGQPR